MSEEQKVDDQEAMADEWAAALDEQGAAEQDVDVDNILGGTDVAAANENVDRAPLQQLSPEKVDTSEVNLDSILDVPVTIAMEIGRTRMPIRNLLQLNQGSVVELDRLAGEPMDVLVNGTLIAQGEVVVVNEKFGIRLTDIISTSDRIKRLA